MTNAKLLLALALAACTESAETQKPEAAAEDLIVTPTEKGVTGSLGATTFTSACTSRATACAALSALVSTSSSGTCQRV